MAEYIAPFSLPTPKRVHGPTMHSHSYSSLCISANKLAELRPLLGKLGFRYLLRFVNASPVVAMLVAPTKGIRMRTIRPWSGHYRPSYGLVMFESEIGVVIVAICLSQMTGHTLFPYSHEPQFALCHIMKPMMYYLGHCSQPVPRMDKLCRRPLLIATEGLCQRSSVAPEAPTMR